MAAADKALQQLVGDIIILSEQLTTQIHRHTAGAVLSDNFLQAGRSRGQRQRPVCRHAVDHRLQQPALSIQGFSQCSAFDT